MEVSNEFEEGTSVSRIYVASLERCGSKNSKMKLPSQRVKGPEITRSLKVPKLSAIIALVSDKSLTRIFKSHVDKGNM
jgi:hypothetical protein